MLIKTGNKSNGYLLMHSKKGLDNKKILENVKCRSNGEDVIMSFSSATKIASNAFECVYEDKPCIIFEEEEKVVVSMAYRSVDTSKGVYYLIFVLDDNKDVKPLVYNVVKNVFQPIKDAMRILGSHVYADGVLFTVNSKFSVSSYTLNLHRRKYLENIALIDGSTINGRKTYAIIKKESPLFELGDEDIYNKKLNYDSGSGWFLLSDDNGFTLIITSITGVFHNTTIDKIIECEVDGLATKDKVILCHTDKLKYWVWRGRCVEATQPVPTKSGFMMLKGSRIKKLNQDEIVNLNKLFAEDAIRKTTSDTVDLATYASIRFKLLDGKLLANNKVADITVKDSSIMIGDKEIHAGYHMKKKLEDVFLEEKPSYVFSLLNTKDYPCYLANTKITVNNSRVYADTVITSFFGEMSRTTRDYGRDEFKTIDMNTFALFSDNDWKIFKIRNHAVMIDKFGKYPMVFLASPYAIGIKDDRFVIYKELFTDHMTTITADLIKITDNGFALFNTDSGKCILANNNGNIKEIKLEEWLCAQFLDLFDTKTWTERYASMKNTYFVTKYDLENLKVF